MRFSLELPTQRVESPDEFVRSPAIAEVTTVAASADPTIALHTNIGVSAGHLKPEYGVTWATVTLPGADGSELLNNVSAFGRDVIDQVV